MAAKSDLPGDLQKLVDIVGAPVTSKDVDVWSRFQEIQDRSHRLRTILEAWKAQQSQDRQLRERYALWLLVAMAVQATVINVIYVLMGTGLLTLDPWTGRTFIMAVFAEIVALVLIVVKYLFTPSGDKILTLTAEVKPRPTPRAKPKAKPTLPQ
jgi:hypothetical protein